jgi:hypothetical protein
MGFLFSFIAILCESLAKTVDKLNIRRNRTTYRQLLLLTFFGMAVLLLAFILLTKQAFPQLTLLTLGLLSLIALVSFGANIFDDLSLRVDDLSLREPMVDFGPVLAGLIGYALFPAERKPIFLLAFIFGAAVVYWGTHRRKLGKLQKRGMAYLLLSTVLNAFLPSIYQTTLAHLSPAYITLFRCAAIFILLAIFMPVRKITKLSSGKITYSFGAAMLYALESVVSLYAIMSLGVVLTMLILMLGPALRYLSGYYILKEKVHTGEMIASFLLAIIVLIAVAQ